MTDTTVPAIAGAQPSADANTVDSILDNAASGQQQPQDSQSDPAAEPNEADGNKPDDGQFPKKAVNAISRRDKTIGKLRAQLEAANAEMAKYREPQATQKPQGGQSKDDGKPKPENYQNYADYMEAMQDYKIEQRISALKEEQGKTAQSAQDQAWMAGRDKEIESQAAGIAKENPEVASVILENADVFDDFSPALQRLFYQAENPVMAAYNLAKDGKLEALIDMPLAQAAMEIGRAQSQPYTKPKSKAPTPMPASRGAASGGKELADKSPREKLAFLTGD